MREIPVPERVHRGEHELVVTWDAGHAGVYPYRMLRLACHCATCREELTGRPLLDPGVVPEGVRAEEVSLVGAYAIKIRWSDGHDTGIYTYEYLLSLCPCGRCRATTSGDEQGRARTGGGGCAR